MGLWTTWYVDRLFGHLAQTLGPAITVYPDLQTEALTAASVPPATCARSCTVEAAAMLAMLPVIDYAFMLRVCVSIKGCCLRTQRSIPCLPSLD